MVGYADLTGAVELRNSVSDRFGVELPATVTFDCPTPQALAGFIAARTAPDSTVAESPHMSAVASEASLESIRAQLQSAVDELLGFAVERDQPLMEAGLDSIGDNLAPSRQLDIQAMAVSFCFCARSLTR